MSEASNEDDDELAAMAAAQAKGFDAEGKCTSYFLASMVIGELIRHGVVSQENCDLAIEIATEEITAQRAIRDFGPF